MPRGCPVPVSVYSYVSRTPGAVLLEGAPNAGQGEPWTRLFTAPLRICTAWAAAEVPQLFAQIEREVAAGRFAAGFFAYECGAAFEPRARMHPPRAGQPLAWFGIYDRDYRFNHATGAFESGAPCMEPVSPSGDVSDTSAQFAMNEQQYISRIEAIHEWIRAGDIYQLNFTAPLRLQTSADPALLYARLRARQPAQYGALIHWEPERRVLCFSPELFFWLSEGGPTRRIVTRPMKGTAPRGRTTAEDRTTAEWLRHDAKNRSENLMIVDLIRNDLGRLAHFGTVRVEALFSVQKLPTLWQMTSTVTAELGEEAGMEAIFRALFPSGSITGAPKIRAMQLISELETEPRGVYTGAIGFFSATETIFNVAIRTIELDGATGAMGVGGGIVIDSEPSSEFRECLLKARFLTEKSPENFSLIETMLWKDGFPLLPLHLDRLADSAAYFDFDCNRDGIKAQIEKYAAIFEPGVARRVRLLLARDGTAAITHEPVIAESEPIRVCIATPRTDSTDPMLFHKTTCRPLYDSVYKAAARAGFADALFFNQREELTEGAIGNIFLVRDGRWRTPPIECGLLPGVYRRHLLEAQPEVEERILRIEDLREADTVYHSNAVRGLRRVEVDWTTETSPQS